MAGTAAVCSGLSVGTPPAAALTCARVAAADGSDSGTGTAAQPFRTAQRLADSLHPGETGCLRAGVYAGNVTISRSGAPGAAITITSFAGERAAIAGKLWVTDSANFVVVDSLDLDGRNPAGLPSPAIDGDDVAFTNNDVTNGHTASCFILGPTTYGRAYRTLIARNRIHDCGRLPATNFDHGIYLEHATGAHLVDNVIYDNADRGVQLYPDAQGSYIARNLIDGNGHGVLIGGGDEDYGPQASNDNLIEHNVVTNSSRGFNVLWYWGSALVGQRNVVRGNCIWGGARDGDNHGLAPEHGFTADDNVMADPLYTDRSGKDFRLQPGSPCSDLAGARDRDSRSRSTRIVLHHPSSPVRPGRRVVLSGRVTGGKRPRRVVLRTRAARRWKSLCKARVRRDGRFRARVGLRRRSTGRLLIRQVRLPRHAGALRLHASARGMGRSNVVRIRVLR